MNRTPQRVLINHFQSAVGAVSTANFRKHRNQLSFDVFRIFATPAGTTWEQEENFHFLLPSANNKANHSPPITRTKHDRIRSEELMPKGNGVRPQGLSVIRSDPFIHSGSEDGAKMMGFRWVACDRSIDSKETDNPTGEWIRRLKMLYWHDFAICQILDHV